MSDTVHEIQMREAKRLIRNKVDAMFREKDDDGRNLYLTDPSYRDDCMEQLNKNMDSYEG